MTIGILKESGDETRVSFLPEHILKLKKEGLSFAVEKGAGENAFASDSEYSEAGAGVMAREDVLKESDILISVNAPDAQTITRIRKDTILISTLNPLSDPGIISPLNKAGLTSFSLDQIPRITRGQAMDVLSSMATVAGYKAVLRAAYELPNFFPMFMSAAGTIRPAKVLILGAGVAGLQAIATAKKLGSVVEVFDVRSAVKDEVTSLGGKFVEVEGAKEDKAAGGYAVEQTEEFKARQAKLIQDRAAASNVVICTAQIPGRKAPLLITKETVDMMKPGSVIIDLAASSGGNCELTQNNETVVHKGIKIIGESNFPATTSSDASRMYGTNLLNFLKLIINDKSELNLDFDDEIIKGTCLTREGNLVNERVKSILNQ
jgi:NAD(P) transhydrogenase subunit alpha